MESGGRFNRAVLVYVAKFYPGVEMSQRPGAKADAKRLHRVLRRLGYQVELHKDLSSEEIHQLYREESRRPVKDHFLSVLSSHGHDGCVFGADGKAVQLSRIFSRFDSDCMKDKTKLFLVQACRGHRLDDGVKLNSGGGSDGDSDSSAASDSAAGDPSDPSNPSVLHDLSLPVDAAVMFAAAPGYGAFTNPQGSFFLQTFCELLEDPESRKLELSRLMTRISHRVAHGFQARGRRFGGSRMMPCFLARLTRDAFPFARPGKEGGASEINATSLVEMARNRSPSIS